MKKIMMLGGSSVLIPVIECAHKLGLYVITCDYLPHNAAHKYSDEYVNVSVVDKDKVLKVAIMNEIDGIISFACDAGVVSAAYVAEKMNLPFQCSYNTAVILQDKGLFRDFLKKNGFNCPKAKTYKSLEMALKDEKEFKWPVIVKPTDSAGSKGVSRVNDIGEMENAIKNALDVSRNKTFIVEEFLFFEGYHSSSDPFTIDGKIEFITYSDQLFDENAINQYVPSLIIWPSTMRTNYQKQLTEELQRILYLLNVKTGIYNIETCVSGGKTYIMEISPRGGGCNIAELQNSAYGVDLIEYEIRKAVGMEVPKIREKECEGSWCEVVIHANVSKEERLCEIIIDPDFEKKYIVKKDILVERGDVIEPYTGGNRAVGYLLLHFESREMLDQMVEKYEKWLNITYL